MYTYIYAAWHVESWVKSCKMYTDRLILRFVVKWQFVEEMRLFWYNDLLCWFLLPCKVPKRVRCAKHPRVTELCRESITSILSLSTKSSLTYCSCLFSLEFNQDHKSKSTSPRAWSRNFLFLREELFTHGNQRKAGKHLPGKLRISSNSSNKNESKAWINEPRETKNDGTK